MKISQIAQRDILDRMGSEASDAEASAMLVILDRRGVTDTDDLSDGEWQAMIVGAVELAAQRGKETL